MYVYKVYDEMEKGFHQGGMYPKAIAKKEDAGKIWGSFTKLKAFLRQYLERARNEVPDSWVVVEYELIQVRRFSARQLGYQIFAQDKLKEKTRGEILSQAITKRQEEEERAEFARLKQKFEPIQQGDL